MRLVFLGPPGAGKGTQADRICKDFGIIQLSTGDILRSHKARGTELGKKAKAYMDVGELVPDTIIIDMIKEELNRLDDHRGYILDGFPRTVPQAEALDGLLDEIGQKLDTVLVLDVPNDYLVERLTARRTCKVCGRTYHLLFSPPKDDEKCDVDGSDLYQRPDDTKETVMNRLSVYEQQTKPLIDYYNKKDLANIIDGNQKIDLVYKSIKSILENYN